MKITQRLAAIGLNVAYVLLLLGFVISGLIPQFRRMDILGGFWSKLFGRVPRFDSSHGPVIWFHAVSVGDAMVCQPVIERLKSSFPGYQFAISVSTPDGLDVAKLAFPNDIVFFAPYDFTWAVKRVYRKLVPKILVIAENDFWPNLMREAHDRSVPLAIFNTRIARREQVEHQYDGWILRSGLRRTAWWGVITTEDADWIKRLFQVSSPPVSVTGSLKSDGILRERSNSRTMQLKKQLGFHSTDQIFVAGSTHESEEEVIVSIFETLQKDWPSLRLILVPRNGYRFDLVADLLNRHSVPFVRFSEVDSNRDSGPLVTLVDSIGLLRDIWGLAD
ncbi:MAG: hypothetical protein FJ267_16755, partial [Planctomycetes bacterium]|nr:hypothetical protein [Planctomycetota bacterium]